MEWIDKPKIVKEIGPGPWRSRYAWLPKRLSDRWIWLEPFEERNSFRFLGNEETRMGFYLAYASIVERRKVAN